MSSIWRDIKPTSERITFFPKAGITMEQVKAYFKEHYPCACWRWCANGDDPTAEGFNVILIKTYCEEEDDEDYSDESDSEDEE